MAAMYKCPITGEAKDGRGAAQALVQLTPTVRVNLQFFEASESVKGQFNPAEVSPEAVELLKAHIQAFKPKK